MEPFRLDDLRNHHCVLLIFGASQKDPACEGQMRQFADQAAACAERDLLLVEVFRQGGGVVHRPAARGFTRQTIREEDVNTLRERFDVEPERFAMILLDKDGEAQRRDNAPVKPGAVFNHIDKIQNPKPII